MTAIEKLQIRLELNKFKMAEMDVHPERNGIILYQIRYTYFTIYKTNFDIQNQ